MRLEIAAKLVAVLRELIEPIREPLAQRARRRIVDVCMKSRTPARGYVALYRSVSGADV